MASANKNLSKYDSSMVPNGTSFRICLIVSEWNHEITNRLYIGAQKTLFVHNVLPENIVKIHVM